MHLKKAPNSSIYKESRAFFTQSSAKLRIVARPEKKCKCFLQFFSNFFLRLKICVHAGKQAFIPRLGTAAALGCNIIMCRIRLDCFSAISRNLRTFPKFRSPLSSQALFPLCLHLSSRSQYLLHGAA